MTALTDAQALLQRMSSRGLSVERVGQHLLVSPKRMLNDELRTEIRSLRHTLLRIVKGQRELACTHDVLERAAFLEFCEGMEREQADAMALGEFGYTSWEELASVHATLEAKEAG